jgi:hypothetical protein
MPKPPDPPSPAEDRRLRADLVAGGAAALVVLDSV